jgi:hypothetical protein
MRAPLIANGHRSQHGYYRKGWLPIHGRLDQRRIYRGRVSKNPEPTKAQKLMAKVMIDPATQIAFNSKKGSEPARLDIDPSKLDAIAQYGMKALQKPDQRIPTVDFLVTPDFIGAQRDLAGQLWANKSMTADQFVNAFVKIVEPKKRIRKRPFSENPASREKWRDTPKDSGNGTETETRTDRLWNQRYRHGKTEPQKDGRRWSTGGSRGIGKAIAIGLAEAGAEVGVLSRKTRREGENA